MSWRNTVTFGTPAEARFVTVTPRLGFRSQTFKLLVDLGTTGRFSVTRWARVGA
jgi:hypothetical protein